jgi:hypothetical protein
MRPSVAIAFVCAATSAHAEPGPPHPCAWRHYDEEPSCPGKVAVLDYNDEPNSVGPRYGQLPDSEPLSPSPVPPPPPPPRPPSIDYERLWGWQCEVALGLGSAVVDGIGVGNWPQLSGAIGMQHARVTLMGEYSLGAEHFHAPQDGVIALGSAQLPARDTDGLVHRFGAVARYAVLHGTVDTDGGSQLGGDIWLQGDFGEELTRWDEGGLLERPYLGVGLGIQGALRGAPHRRHALYVALRMQIARRSDVGSAAATCSAPCTEATPPEAWSDRSWQLRLGFLWGD